MHKSMLIIKQDMCIWYVVCIHNEDIYEPYARVFLQLIILIDNYSIEPLIIEIAR